VSDAPEKAHSELGASVAKRWLECPGSVRLSRAIPGGQKSVYAAEGTLAHLIAERSLTKGADPDMWVGMKYTIDGFELEVTEDMADVVRVFVEHCRVLMGERNPGDTYGRHTTHWVERRFNLAALNPPAPMFGTADFVAYNADADELHVVDLKYGQGVVVEAEGNPQLRYYALGAVLSLPDIRPQLITMTIVQPRAGHPDGIIRSETITYDELIGFAGELIEAARKTFEPDAPLNPGAHCRFCPAAGVCPAQRDQATALAQIEFDAVPAMQPRAPETLSNDELSKVLRIAPMVEDWLSAVRAQVQGRLERGEEVPNFKLVEKRATRKWKDEDETAQLLEARGHEDESVYQPSKLKSPAQIEKLLGKRDFAETLSAHVVKISSGYNVVPLDDPRPAIALAAAHEFPALPESTSEN